MELTLEGGGAHIGGCDGAPLWACHVDVDGKVAVATGWTLEGEACTTGPLGAYGDPI